MSNIYKEFYNKLIGEKFNTVIRKLQVEIEQKYNQETLSIV